MFISSAFAAEIVTEIPEGATVMQPSAGEQFLWNMGLILVLVVLFYVLLILPQQRRFKEHSAMLAGLQKGDKIVTGGGLVGVIDKMVDDHEAVIDLGNGMKVTVMRSSLQKRDTALLRKKAANDSKTKDKNKG